MSDAPSQSKVESVEGTREGRRARSCSARSWIFSCMSEYVCTCIGEAGSSYCPPDLPQGATGGNVDSFGERALPAGGEQWGYERTDHSFIVAVG